MKNCLGCTSRESEAGSHNNSPPPQDAWIIYEIFEHQVAVLKNLSTGHNLAVQLPGKEDAPIKFHKGHVFRVIDWEHNVDIIVQIDPNTGEWLAVALMHPRFRHLPILYYRP